MESVEAEAGRRELQDTYRGVWKEEFYSIIKWVKSKYKFSEDIATLDSYVKNVESLIGLTKEILYLEYSEAYSSRPSSQERILYGNGVRSSLNLTEGEIYRDASIQLVSNSYVYSPPYTFIEKIMRMSTLNSTSNF
jgi:hypothetical protein